MKWHRMKRVVEELKKIDDEAAKIRAGASQKAEELVAYTHQRATKLVDAA